MDTQWCLTCGRHIEDERDLYCSNQCYREANPSSPSAFHRPSPTLIPSIPSSTDARILAWRSKVAPGAPERLTRPSTPSSRSRHSQSSQYHHHVQRPTIRESSPSSASASSSSTPGRTRPKLVQLATSPVSPSVSLTFSPLQQRDRPPAPAPAVPTAISPSSTTGRHYQHHHLTARHDVSRRSSMTCTTAITSDDSVATPVTPTVPLGIPIEPAPTDAYKLSLWKRVRTWVGPTSPPHVAGVDNHFPAFGAHRKHTALYIDEETLERCDSAPVSIDSLDDDDEDDSERGSGLAGWFAHRAEEQQQQQQQQQHQQKRQIAFQKREQKLDRAMAQASYYAIR